MGVDLYMFPKDKKHDLGANCWRSFAADGMFEETLEDGECALYAFIQAGDIEDDSELEYHDPTKVLKEIEKAIAIAKAADEDRFDCGKDAILEELEEMKAAAQKAVAYKDTINLNMG